MNLDWVRYDEIRDVAERRCALCKEPVDEEEEVLANLDELPTPWLCPDCAEVVAQLARRPSP